MKDCQGGEYQNSLKHDQTNQYDLKNTSIRSSVKILEEQEKMTLRKSLNGFFFLLLVSVLGAAPPIITRHDRDPSRFEKLGNEFWGVLVDLKVPTQKFPAGRRGNGVGVLIDSQWVLTAAHVAAGLKANKSDDRIEYSHTVTVGGKEFNQDYVVLHPEWKEYGPADIALIHLTSPVQSFRRVFPYERRDEIGKIITVVGWGDFGTGLTGPTTMDQKLRGATNKIDEVTEDNIIFSFDDPDSKGTTDLEGISGPGDSGGPALLEMKGKFYVLGVSVAQDGRGHGRGRYGATEFYTRVSTYAKWIKKMMRTR